MKTDIEAYTTSETKTKRFFHIINSIPKETNSILDIGCARSSTEERKKNNLHALLVERTGAKVKGIDIVEDPVRDMKKEGYNVEVADAQEFNLNEKFDVIVAGEVIEYLPNVGMFFDRVFEHLHDNGKLIFTTENPKALVHWRTGLQKKQDVNSIYINPFKISELHPQIKQENIKISWISPIGGLSGLLWRMGYKSSSAPRFCAVVNNNNKNL